MISVITHGGSDGCVKDNVAHGGVNKNLHDAIYIETKAVPHGYS